MISGLRPLCLSCLCLFLAAFPGAAEEYEIRLERTFKAGDRFKAHATGEYDLRVNTTEGGKTTPITRSYQVDFVAVSTIVSVDDKGRDTLVEHKIEKCVRTEDRVVSELLPAGKVLVIETGVGKQTIRLKDENLPDAVKRDLDVILQETRLTVSLDDFFGTTKRQPVGGEWKIDARAMSLAYQQELGLAIREENVHGSGALAKILRVGDTECMNVIVKLGVKGTVRKTPGVEILDDEVIVYNSAVYPIDVKRRALSLKSATTHRMTAIFKSENNRRDVVVEKKVRTWKTEDLPDSKQD